MPASEETSGAGSDPARPVHETETVIYGPNRDSGEPDRADGDSQERTEIAPYDEFSRTLVEIGLVDQRELQSFAGDSAQDVLGLSRDLVKAGKLTTAAKTRAMCRDVPVPDRELRGNGTVVWQYAVPSRSEVPQAHRGRDSQPGRGLHQACTGHGASCVAEAAVG
jgi:hypothetical protein